MLYDPVEGLGDDKYLPATPFCVLRAHFNYLPLSHLQPDSLQALHRGADEQWHFLPSRQCQALAREAAEQRRFLERNN